MDYGETRPPIRPANMAAVEELERALDQAGAPETMRDAVGATWHVEPLPLEPPSLLEARAELEQRWHQMDAKLTIVMHLVSVLCTRFNVDQAEVAQAKAAWKELASGDGATKA